MNARLKTVAPAHADTPPSPLQPSLEPMAARWTLPQVMEQAQALLAQGHGAQADQVYRAWLAAHPRARMREAALFNHAAVLQTLGRMDEAAGAYRECMEIAPAFGQAYINLGLMLERQGRTEAALQIWSQYVGQRLLQGSADLEMHCTALNHIGRVQEARKHYDLAERALEESLRLQPQQPGVMQHWVHIRQKACKWPVIEPLPGLSTGDLLRCTSPLAMLALTDDPELQLMTAQRFVHRTYTTAQECLHDKKRQPGLRWRVGLVSADLREHAVGFLLPAFLAGVDAQRYELFAYDYTAPEQTPLRRQLEGLFDHMRNIAALSDRQAAELIAQDQIDILIDLHGLSSGARPGIFALHPAPHQLTYLGYIGSTGMPFFDHVVVDPQVMPEELVPHFTEKPLYLSSSFIPLTHDAPSPLVITREEAGLPPQAFVMAAFGNVYKITPEMFACWMRCLQRIEGSVLWLIDDNPVTTGNLRAAALSHGVDPARLVFAPRCAPDRFRAQLRLADVYLDSYPYNCGSTSNDVVNAEVPLVSLYGRTLVSRMGLSILTELGQPDLAVPTYQAYEDKVLEVALRVQAGHRYSYRRRTGLRPLMEALDQIRRTAAATHGSCAVVCRAPTSAPIAASWIRSLAWPRHQDARGTAWMHTWQEHEWLTQQLLAPALDSHHLYAFDLPDWTEATGWTADQWQARLSALAPGHDAVVLAVDWLRHSAYRNPWLALGDGRENWLKTAQTVVQMLGHDPNLLTHLHPSATSLRGLTLAARKPVWMNWLKLSGQLRRWTHDECSALGQALRQTHDLEGVSMSSAQMIHSLLMNLVLSDPRWKVASVPRETLQDRNRPPEALVRWGLQCDALKQAARVDGSQDFVRQFDRLSTRLQRRLINTSLFARRAD